MQMIEGIRNYFTEEELSCPCCNVYSFNKETLAKLNHIRDSLGFPFIINSGYRCPSYNEKRGFTQTHATGQAVDISATHERAFQIMSMAAQFEFTGIGINQKGGNRFIHLDDLTKSYGRPRPHVWSY